MDRLFQRRSDGQTIRLKDADALGAGGEAHVYVVPPDGRRVAKVYRQPTPERAAKLAVMLANPPQDPMASHGHVSIAWPTDLLQMPGGTHSVVGFVMPRATDTRPVIDYYNPAARRRLCPLFDYFYLHRMARNVASAIHAVHERGYVIGDVNESNILVTDTALATLVDTDSFQVRDPQTGDLYRCPVGKPEYTPPEIQGTAFRSLERRPTHDLFGLGVLVFQFLMEGTHPFAGIFTGEGEPPPVEARIREGHFVCGPNPGPYRPMPAAPPFSLLPPSLRQLFVLCFDDGHRDPALRPTAQTWVAALHEVEDTLLTCTINAQHRYGAHLAACPWCERAARLGGRDPFPSVHQIQQSTAAPSGGRQSALPPASLPSAAAPPPTVSPPPPPPIRPAPVTGMGPNIPLASPSIPASALRPVPRFSGKSMALIGAVSVALILLLWVFGHAMSAAQTRRRAAAQDVASATRLLADAQTDARAFPTGDADAGQVAAQLQFRLQRCAEAQKQCQEALALDHSNTRAAAVSEQAAQAMKQVQADTEAQAARVLDTQVMQSIVRFKNQTLTDQQAAQVRDTLKAQARDAMAHCDAAIRLDPTNQVAWVQRVRALRLFGDVPAARRAVEQAVVLFPDNQELQEQRRLIGGT